MELTHTIKDRHLDSRRHCTPLDGSGAHERAQEGKRRRKERRRREGSNPKGEEVARSEGMI
jgi:hypothetical protein